MIQPFWTNICLLKRNKNINVGHCKTTVATTAIEIKNEEGKKNAISNAL